MTKILTRDLANLKLLARRITTLEKMFDSPSGFAIIIIHLRSNVEEDKHSLSL